MRRRIAVTTLAASAVIAAAAPSALAIPGSPGGAAAPAGPAAQVRPQRAPSQARKASPERPLIGELALPAQIAPGRPPKVVVMVDESGVSKVDVRVSIGETVGGAALLVAQLGWVPTGRHVTVAWPSGASLQAGHYMLWVNAHDRRNDNLQRVAGNTGEAPLAVLAPAPVESTTPSQPGVPTVAETVADGAVFPVAGPHSFGGPENAFGAPRTGYLHQGQDILTAEGTPDVAPFAGEVMAMSYQEGGGGWYVTVHTSIGFDLFFAHCEAGSVQVVVGQHVGAGQMLCRAGQTGDATTPHLDFEMWVDGWHSTGSFPVDPLPYLKAWEAADSAA